MSSNSRETLVGLGHIALAVVIFSPGYYRAVFFQAEVVPATTHNRDEAYVRQRNVALTRVVRSPSFYAAIGRAGCCNRGAGIAETSCSEKYILGLLDRDDYEEVKESAEREVYSARAELLKMDRNDKPITEILENALEVEVLKHL